jgi:thymidylate synthase (FAD)
MQVELLSHWGDDLTVVNNARVSFDKESQELTQQDIRLIGYLARGCTLGDYEEMISELCLTGEADQVIQIVDHWRRTPTHWAPFANGVGARFRVKAPIPIMRQLFKHKVGSVESEVSRRYVSDEPEVHRPTAWRKAAENVKQGSGEHFDLKMQMLFDSAYEDAVTEALASYDYMIRQGVCPEQARFVLPQGAYSEAIISHSLYGWANVFNQRTDPHAQQEIAEVARQVGNALAQEFPVSWDALTA